MEHNFVKRSVTPLAVTLLLVSFSFHAESQVLEGISSMFFKSPLQKAIDRGLKPDGDLAQEISDLDNYQVDSKKDAWAICEALKQLPLPPGRESKKSSRSAVYQLAVLFQQVKDENSPAIPFLRDEGIDELVRIFDVLMASPDKDSQEDLLFVLKILAMYQTPEGTDRVIKAARQPIKADDYLWSVILSQYDAEHMEHKRLLEALSDPLPSAFIGISLLDAANAIAIGGEKIDHPFDSPAGKKRLHDWLTDSNPEHFSYAHSATAALPFISEPERSQLMGLALDHHEVSIQLEAAWASAKLGSDAGLKLLVRYCEDINHSSKAQRYLEELGREDAIPAKAKDAEFQAQAKFAEWLAHPNELARAPDELVVVDTRELSWPADGERHKFWLLRYVVRETNGLDDDQIGVGLVGSITWSFFATELASLPPEDCYAKHCMWECEHGDLVTEIEDASAEDKDRLLAKWVQGKLDEVKFKRIYQLAPELKHPERVIGVAEAKLVGVHGYAVFDGAKSRWYPKSEFPDGTSAGEALDFHLGRALLGLKDEPDRRRFFQPPARKREPQQIVDAYEKLLTEAEKGENFHRIELLSDIGALSTHFKNYADALATTRGISQDQSVVMAYDRLLSLATQLPAESRAKAYDSFTPLGEAFDDYVKSLLATKDTTRVESTIELFAPHWDHNLGNGKLGELAFKIGRNDLAERHLHKLSKEGVRIHVGEEMSMLAEIWKKDGRDAEAKALLLESLRACQKEVGTHEDDDEAEQQVAEAYQKHLATFLRLFPEDSAAVLEREKLPVSIGKTPRRTSND